MSPRGYRGVEGVARAGSVAAAAPPSVAAVSDSVWPPPHPTTPILAIASMLTHILTSPPSSRSRFRARQRARNSCVCRLRHEIRCRCTQIVRKPGSFRALRTSTARFLPTGTVGTWSDGFPPSFLFIALLLITSPVAAQRLSDAVIPEHYTLWFAPDLEKETFRGRETIRVQIRKPHGTLRLHAAEIEFGDVTITADGRTQTAQVTLEPRTETATLTVPQEIPAGTGDPPDHLQRHPQRQAPRLLSEPGQRPEIRGHADGGNRRPPGVSVIRRAQVQGDVRLSLMVDAARYGDLQRRSGFRRPGARIGQAHGVVRHHAEDVDLPGRA